PLALPRPPPRSASPFPYTTLFRSELALGLLDRVLQAVPLLLGRAPGLRHLDLGPVQPVHAPDGQARRGGHAADHAGLLGGAGHRDRKSTRLNSSHVKISYAVFCLK